MKKIILTIICCILSTTLLFNFKAQASIFVPSTDKYIWQAIERVVIVHENNNQTIVLSPLYIGDKTDFAWIIPTPNKLNIESVNYDLFSNLDNISNNDLAIYKDIVESTTEFKNLENNKQDLYTINTFKFSESDEIIKWLSSNKYDLPDYSNYLLNDYIQKDWYFNIIEVNSKNLIENMGYLPPLSISFNSNNLVYPIKLKSLRLLWQNPVPENSEENIKEVKEKLQEGQTNFNTTSNYSIDSMPSTTSIDMYILSENRKSHSDFKTTYASWLNKDEVESLSKTSNSKNWYNCQNSKLFFTKMHSSINYTHYESDLVFEDALNNKQILNNQDSSNNLNISMWIYSIISLIFLILLFISPIGLSFALGLYLTKLEKSGIRKITGLLLESIALISLMSLMVFSYFLIWQGYLKKINFDRFKFNWNNADYNFNEETIKYFVVSVLIAQFIFLLWMILFWVLQNKKKPTLTTHDGKSSKELNNHNEIGEHIFKKGSNNKDYQDPEFEVELENKSKESIEIKDNRKNLPSFTPEKPKSKIIKPKTQKIKVNKG